MMSARCFLSFLLLCLFGPHLPEAAAQSTRVRGRVTDAVTGQPLPYVSVLFPQTTTGTTTDEEGIYAIETRDTSATVTATIVGYEPQTRAVVRRAYNTLDFALQPQQIGIAEVVVLPGENPAHPILDRFLRNKGRNDHRQLPRYRCATYTKMELDLANVKPGFRSKRLQRNFGFIFDYVDTSALTGQIYLPAMISESTAECYHSRRPDVDREVIRATRVSGIDNDASVAQFTGALQGGFSFYDNFIELFNVRFASPLADGGRSFYNYFLVDSLPAGGRKTYVIRFHPKRLTTPVLDGEIRIDSASCALQSASARMPKGVNVNWIKHLYIESTHRPLNDTTWFPERDRYTAEFSLAMRDSAKMVSFLGTREVNYSKVEFPASLPPEVLAMDRSVVFEPDPAQQQRDEAYWASARPYRLTERERNIYRMVDSVQHVPLYRNIYTLINTFLVGYYNTKYIGIGPYYKIASFNKLEGFRMQFGARTTAALSRKVRIGGYAAYGTRDERVKGGGSLEWVLHPRLTRKLTLSGSHDVVQLGAGQNALTESNILSSVFSRGGRQRLSMVNRFTGLYEHEWVHGFSTFAGIRLQRIYGNEYVPLVRPDGTVLNSIGDAQLQIGLRFAHKERIYRQAFTARHLRSDYPVLTLSLIRGEPALLQGASSYYRLEGGVHYQPKTPPLGYADITLQGGRIFGTVPYPLLKLHEGNGTYFYDPYAFSCMNYYEFGSDKWVSLFYEHHFNGWILGRIPLLKRLKWREVLVCKGVWGTLSECNDGSLADSEAPLLFPAGMTSVDRPYVEAGFGVENIFRLLRVDCIWRLTHRDPMPGQEVQNFAVNFSLHMKF